MLGGRGPTDGSLAVFDDGTTDVVGFHMTARFVVGFEYACRGCMGRLKAGVAVEQGTLL